MERAVTAANHVTQRPIGCLLGNSTTVRLVSSDVAQFRERFLIQFVHKVTNYFPIWFGLYTERTAIAAQWFTAAVKLKTISAMQQR